ncbi:glycosyltransferase [Arthrobacter sp. FW306-07-I]|uniref:glycosyltransferase n=1 Tax=Arthrobacter sp. FW306-07-I TaxID=2879622 RepID=UPI003FA46FCB|nr:glycosyltransferase [Arthrobacter sp. FW306-07-I]
MTKPRIVQHSFGSKGTGGPIGALTRVLESDIATSFEFLHVAQPYAAGGLNLKMIYMMAKEMRTFRPDIAHIRGLGNEGFHGVIAAKVARVPKVLVSVHGSVRDLVSGSAGFRRWIVGSILEPLTLRLSTHIVTVCEDAMEKPVLQPFADKLLGVVPNGVDLPTPRTDNRRAVRSALSIGTDDVVLIIVGRLVVDKGGFDLLEALDLIPAEVHSQSIHLLIVGEGPDRESLSARAQLIENVQIHILGLRHDVSELFAASDIAILPSWHENMSNALLEAMAAGAPVIATRVGGNTEVLSKGGGILVPSQNPSALASAICRLVHNNQERVALGKEARSVIERFYTTGHMTQHLSHIYRTILRS